MSRDSPPPIPGLGQPPDPTSAEYNAEPQLFGSIDRNGSVKEEATVVNHAGSERMRRILKRRQRAYVQAELHRHRSLAAVPNEKAPSRPLSSVAVRGQQVAAERRALGTRRRRASKSSILTGSISEQSLSPVEGSSEETSEVERKPVEHQSVGIGNSERNDVPATPSEQQANTPPLEEEVRVAGYLLLEQSGGEVSGENTPSPSSPRQGEARRAEPTAVARPATTKKNGGSGVQWGSNIELKIGLRMVYEVYGKFTQQQQADVWNEVFKKELADRRQFVSVEIMRKQWKERNRELGTPSVRQWKEVVLAIESDDQRWVDMKERFEVAIDELDRKGGWRT